MSETSRSSIFRSKMKIEAEKNKEKKYVDVPLRPMMPREYSARRRVELRKFEQSILESSNKNIGIEPGE